MKKALTITSNVLLTVGLAIFAGSFLFGPGALTVLGWLVMLPMFVGCVGILALTIYDGVTSIEWGKGKNNISMSGIDTNKTAQATN